MPLPPSVPRDELHLRRIELRGYRRADGLYDIEAHMVDTKTRELTLPDGRLWNETTDERHHARDSGRCQARAKPRAGMPRSR